MVKDTLKILRYEQCRIFKVCLTVFLLLCMNGLIETNAQHIYHAKVCQRKEYSENNIKKY